APSGLMHWPPAAYIKSLYRPFGADALATRCVHKIVGNIAHGTNANLDRVPPASHPAADPDGNAGTGGRRTAERVLRTARRLAVVGRTIAARAERSSPRQRCRE